MPSERRLGFFARRAARRRAGAAAVGLYRAAVEAARAPVFYAEMGVPDTNDGRLEMIGLHAALVMRRLRRGGAGGIMTAQALFDLMFADIDRALREQGVGDLSVGKHVKRAASTFYARAHGLDGALGEADDAALGALVARNLSGAAPPSPAGMRRLAAHLRAFAARLETLSDAALLSGRLDDD